MSAECKTQAPKIGDIKNLRQLNHENHSRFSPTTKH